MRKDTLDERADEILWRALVEDRLRDGGVDDRASDANADLTADEKAALEAGLRLQTELLGLLPYELEPRAPSAASRQRLLARVRGEADGGASTTAEPPAPATAPWNVTQTGAVSSIAAPEVASWDEERRRRTGDGSAEPPRTSAIPPWLGALAAALLVAVLGLTAYASFLYGRLEEQRDRLADQQHAITRLSADLDASRSQVDMLAESRADLQRQLSLVSSPDSEVCPLKPTRDPMFPAARGLLFLSEPRDAWYVRVADVAPPPPGKIYRLWFVLGDKAQPAGILMPAGDGIQEMAGRGLPARTDMTAAAVTLEPMDHSAAQPSGPMVLFGDQRFGMI
jgi:hypothetical protein